MLDDKVRHRLFHGVGLRLFLLMLTVLTSFAGCVNQEPKSSNEFRAVFLSNGQIFFGKLSDMSTDFLTLLDVYYVQTLVDQEKKSAKNILVKRGSEWHSPDSMRINTKHVVVIEPVGTDSMVAKLIREAQTAPAAKPESAAPTPPPAPQTQAPPPQSPPPGSRPRR
jgi:hypothetical protein